MIEIDQNGKKDFSSIQEALDCLAKTPDSGKGETLFLHSGIYREQITVRIPHLTFLGEEDGSTVITGCLSARMEAPEGGPLRTFRTFTCFIDTHDFLLQGNPNRVLCRFLREFNNLFFVTHERKF